MAFQIRNPGKITTEPKYKETKAKNSQTTKSNVIIKQGQAGTYKTEVIGDKTFTTFVPSNVEIYSGSKSGKYGVPSGSKQIASGATSKTITTAEGAKVEVKSTPTPAKAQQERAQAIANAQAQGKKITQEQQNLIAQYKIINPDDKVKRGTAPAEPRQSINVQVSKSDVENFNKEMSSEGIGTAGDFFKASREGRLVFGPNKTFTITTTERKETPIYTTKSEESGLYAPEQYSYQETPRDMNKKEFSLYLTDLKNVITRDQQSAYKTPWERADLKVKQLYYQNVEKNRFKESMTGPLLYSTGSMFYGAISGPGMSVVKTFEGGPGQIAKNVFLPFLPGSKGIIAETIYSLTHPVATTKSAIKQAGENPYILVGQLAGTKALFDIANPIKSITIKKAEIPATQTEQIGTGVAGGKILQQNVVPKVVVKDIIVETKIPGLKYTNYGVVNKVFKGSEVAPGIIDPNLVIGRTPMSTTFMLKGGEWMDYLSKNPLYKELLRTQVVKENKPGEPIDLELGYKLEKTPWEEANYKWNEQLKQYVKEAPKEESATTGGFESPFEKNPFAESGMGKNPFENSGMGSTGTSALTLLNKKKALRPELILVDEEVIRPLKDWRTTSRTETISSPGIMLTPAQNNAFIESLKVKPETQAGTRIDTLTRSKTISGQIGIQGEKTGTAQASTLYTDSGSRSGTRTRQRQNQEQQQNQIQEQVQVQTQTQVQAQRIFQVQAIKTQPKILIPFTNYMRQEKKKESPGYDVFARKKGMFIKINPSAYTKQQAINYGAMITEGTSMASFKITPSSSTPTKSSFMANLKNFYKKGSIFIEKPAFRINTPGELQEITFKGLATPKKKKHRRMNLWGLPI